MNHLTDPQKKDRQKSLFFCSDNTVTDDQQAPPVHSGPPFFGFRAYSRCDRSDLCLPHEVRSQGSENCCRYPKWVNRAGLPLRRSLPVLPCEQTWAASFGMSQRCPQADIAGPRSAEMRGPRSCRFRYIVSAIVAQPLSRTTLSRRVCLSRASVRPERRAQPAPDRSSPVALLSRLA